MSTVAKKDGPPYYTNGTAVFVNIIKKDVYMGQESKTWDITLTLDEGEEDLLAKHGILVKPYKDTLQREFRTQFSLAGKVKMGPDDNIKPIDPALLTYGAKIRIKWIPGVDYPPHGVPALMEAVRVFQLNEGAGSDEADDEF